MRDRAVPRFVQNTVGDSMTKQSFRDECDINNIMRKFERTAMLDHVREVEGGYGDFTNYPQSFHEACDQVLEAERMFMTVPSKVRAKFGNDPGAFIDFVNNPDNLDECRELGLAVPAAVEPAPMRVEVVNPPTEGDGNSST